MRNMMKYGKTYGGEDPQMIEGDVFRIIIKVPEFGADLNQQQQGFKADTAGAQSEAQWQRMLVFLALEPLPAMDLGRCLRPAE